MPKFKVTIKDFIAKTPCDGYYIMTGETTNINAASYINGQKILTNIPQSGFTFDVDYNGTQDHIYVFVVHCDEYIIPVADCTKKRQGGYQVNKIKINCP